MDLSRQEPKVDGRNARRERGKKAVVDAALASFFESDHVPTAEEIAQRAGVSTSSLFRYFNSVDDIRRQAALRFLEQHHPLVDAAPEEDTPLAERLGAYVGLRVECGTLIAPAAMKLRIRGVEIPLLAEVYEQLLARLARQVLAYFGPELSALTPAKGANLAAVIDSLTSVDAYEIMRRVHGRSPTQIRQTWRSTLEGLVTPATTGSGRQPLRA